MTYKLEQFDEDILANKAFFSDLAQLSLNKDYLNALLDEVFVAVDNQNLNVLAHRNEISVLSQLVPSISHAHILVCVIKIHKRSVLFRLNTTVPVISFRYLR